jgi:hypothetical protein
MQHEAPLPTFLVIGAAKSGTTTLFSDLGSHRDVFFPVVKEPSDLTSDKVLAPDGLAAYARLFADARPGQVRGEASTPYTARPQFDGAAERARRLLGPDLKLIYLVRDPIDRLLSDHRYSVQIGKAMSPDINVAIRETPRLVHMSRYAYQLAPWLEHFGREQLRVVAFERYVQDRAAAVTELFDFLGVAVEPDHVLPVEKNRTSDVVAPRGPLRRLVRSEFYRRTVRRLLPPAVRELAKRVVGRPAPIPLQQTLSADSLRYLLAELGPEVEALHAIAGWTAPVWPRFAGSATAAGRIDPQAAELTPLGIGDFLARHPIDGSRAVVAEPQDAVALVGVEDALGVAATEIERKPGRSPTSPDMEM